MLPRTSEGSALFPSALISHHHGHRNQHLPPHDDHLASLSKYTRVRVERYKVVESTPLLGRHCAQGNDRPRVERASARIGICQQNHPMFSVRLSSGKSSIGDDLANFTHGVMEKDATFGMAMDIQWWDGKTTVLGESGNRCKRPARIPREKLVARMIVVDSHDANRFIFCSILRPSRRPARARFPLPVFSSQRRTVSRTAGSGRPGESIGCKLRTAER